MDFEIRLAVNESQKKIRNVQNSELVIWLVLGTTITISYLMMVYKRFMCRRLTARRRIIYGMMVAFVAVCFFVNIAQLKESQDQTLMMHSKSEFKVVRRPPLFLPLSVDNYITYKVKQLGLKPLQNLNTTTVNEPIFNDINQFKYLIHPSTVQCGKVRLALLILIPSAPSNHQKRKAQRETWLKLLGNRSGSSHAFVIGQAGNQEEQERIIKESDHYGDIIQIDMIESYRNLTLKTLGILHWTLNFCPNADYILKVDDDIYVNVDNLFIALKKMKPDHPPSIFGSQEITFLNPDRDPGCLAAYFTTFANISKI